MAVMKILRLGDETLRKKSHPVTKIDRRTIGLLKDMAETMYAADGCGLAAPQVGILRRMVVIDVGDRLIELINPEIIESEGEEIGVEGCLSVPGRRGTVKRPTKVVVRALDKKGREIELTAEGFLARAVCHELDHLDGTVYVDKMIEDVTDQYNREYNQEEN